MKRVICILVIAVLALSMLAGCGGTKSPAGTEQTTKAAGTTKDEGTTAPQEKKLSGKIVLAIWNGQKQADFEEDAKKFMEANPGTQVEIEFIEKIETIKTRMAANELPDIAQVPEEMLKEELPDYYLPLEDMGFTRDNYYFYDEGVASDGHLYKITHMINFSGIVYNKKVFKDAGITSIPKTLDEFWQVCETLKSKGYIPFATNYKDKWPLGGFSIRGSLMQVMSGDPLATEKLKDTDELMAGPFLDNLNFLRTVVEKGYCEPDLMSTNWGAFIADMSAGKYGMTFLGSWFPGQMTDPETRGMFPFPGAKGVSISNDWYMAIAKTTKAPELAKAYFKHLFLTDKTWCQILEYCSAVKGAEYPFPYVTELMSYGVPAMEATPMSDEIQAIINETGVDFDDITQEYMITKDPQSVIKKYNEIWAKARKAVAK